MVQVDDDLVAPAGAQLVYERAQNAGRHHDGGVVVAEGLRRDGRSRVLFGERARDAAASGPADRVVAGGVCKLAELAIAAHLGPNKVREFLGEGGIVEAELLEGSGAHVVHEDVGIGDQLLQNGQALFGFEVQGDPVLVRVVEIDGGIFGLGEFATETRALRALGVAGKRLDLNDLGAHFGQDANGRGGRDVRAHLDHFDARERAVAVQLFGN